MTIVLVAATQPSGFGPLIMAHHKRGKSRTQSSPHTSKKSWKAHEAVGYRWTKHYPRWHDIFYHNRPRRRFDRKVAGDITTDRIDAEVATWAAEKKPHKYYW